jgi:hypothetical protein
MSTADDRILPAMKWTSLVVLVVLVPALVILWGLPGRTASLWAWTIKPDLTPIVLGLGAAELGLAGLYLTLERAGRTASG